MPPLDFLFRPQWHSPIDYVFKLCLSYAWMQVPFPLPLVFVQLLTLSHASSMLQFFDLRSFFLVPSAQQRSRPTSSSSLIPRQQSIESHQPTVLIPGSPRVSPRHCRVIVKRCELGVTAGISPPSCHRVIIKCRELGVVCSWKSSLVCLFVSCLNCLLVLRSLSLSLSSCSWVSIP